MADYGSPNLSFAPVRGWGFDVAAVPTVTAGAYTAGDIVGGLLTFNDVAPRPGYPIVLSSVRVACKADVNLNPTLHLFYTNLAASVANGSVDDNDAYAGGLVAADYLSHMATLAGFVRTDHGTLNTFELNNIGLILGPTAQAIYGLLVDGTGVTLGATSDIEVRVRGAGA